MVNLHHVFTMALSEPIAMSSQLSEKQPIICDTDIRLQLGYYCIYYWKYWWKWWSETYLSCWRWQHLFWDWNRKLQLWRSIYNKHKVVIAEKPVTFNSVLHIYIYVYVIIFFSNTINCRSCGWVRMVYGFRCTGLKNWQSWSPTMIKTLHKLSSTHNKHLHRTVQVFLWAVSQYL